MSENVYVSENGGSVAVCVNMTGELGKDVVAMVQATPGTGKYSI